MRLIIGMAVAFALSGASAQVATERGVLRFIGNASLPPVVSGDSEQARGVAVDLVRAAAQEAGLEVRIEAMNWQQAQAEMKAGRADALLHINSTPERLQTLAFSLPLLESRFHIYRRRERLEIQDLASLAGLRVGVERAGFPAQFLASHPEVHTEFVTTWKDAFARLGRGELDAVFVDQWAGDFALAQAGVANIVTVEPAVVEDQSRVAVAKGNARLLDAINHGLAAIDQNGTRRAILQRWSGQEVVHLTRQSLQRNIVLALAAAAAVGALLILVHLLRLRRLNRELLLSREDLAQALRDAEQANGQLRALTDEQSAVLESEVVGFVRVGDRTILWANPACASMLGYRVEDIVGLPVRALFQSDESFIEFGSQLRQGVAAAGRFRCDSRLVRKDGSVGWFALSMAALDKGGTLLLGAVVDVTSERAARAALREAFDDLHALYNESPIGLHSLGPDGTIVRINDTELQWLGLDRSAVNGRMKFSGLLSPTSSAVFDDQFSRFKADGAIHDLRVDLVTAKGELLPVLINARAVYDDAGAYLTSRFSMLDLHQQSRAQDQMEEAQRIGHVGSWEIDLVSGRIEWSREMRRLFDMSSDAPLSVEATLQAVHPDDRDWVLARYRHACEHGDPMDIRCRLLRVTGEVRHVDMFGTCRRNARGQIVGMVGMARDVSAEVRSAQEIERSNLRYEAIVETQSESICRLRADGTVLLANAQFCRIFGVDDEGFVGRPWTTWTFPDDMAMVDTRLRELTPRSPTVTLEARVLTAVQGVRWMEFIHQGFFDEMGLLVEIQSVGRDITQRKQLEERLRVMNKDFVILLESTSDFIYFKDRRSRFRFCSQTLARITGHASWRDMQGKHDREVFPPDLAAVYETEEGPVFEQGVALLNRVDPYQDEFGQEGWVSTSKWPVFGDDGRTVVGIFGISRIVTEQKRLEDELRRLAATDALTGVASRRSFIEAVRMELARIARHAGAPSAVVMFDLDHFKSINDQHGHAAGDAVLQQVTHLAGQDMRQGDTLGRLGGEEFAVLLVGSGLAEASAFAERLRARIANTPIHLESATLDVTASVGVTTLSPADETQGQVLVRADKAMYRAKQMGRNRVEAEAAAPG